MTPLLDHTALADRVDEKVILHLHRGWRSRFRELEMATFSTKLCQSVPQLHLGQVNA
jgi:hypothetical protein